LSAFFQTWPMRERLAIIADDLTGAADTAVQFAKAGMTTNVLTDVDELHRFARASNVVSFDTETRGCDGRKAYLKVRRSARLLKHSGFGIFFKKLDSTLKGNPGSEIQAMMDELGLSTSILAPAVPENRRTTVDGHMVVNGRVTEGSFIPDLLREGTKAEIRCIPLAVVRRGRRALLERMAKGKGTKDRTIFVVDATNGAELKTIAEVGKELGALLCGASALATQLSRIHRFRPLLAICGSSNEASMRQVKEATDSSLATTVKVDTRGALRKEEAGKVFRLVATKVAGLLGQGEDTIILSAESVEDVSDTIEAAREIGLRPEEARERVVKLLGKIASKVLKECEVRALFVTGGETAFSVLKEIGGYGLRVEQELLPGIPVSKLLGGRHEGLKVVTKAGGFGDVRALSTVFRCLPTG
jgi:uncharacterized protein YgbK (DUF1537 family)